MSSLSTTCAIFVVLLVSYTGFYEASESKCQVVDIAGTPVETARNTIRKEAEGELASGLWEKCRIGNFEVWVSMEATDETLLVMRDESPVVTISPDSLLVFERDGKILAGMADRNGDGAYEFIDYRLREEATGDDREQWDADRDGCPDLRIGTDPTGGRRTEVKFMGKWLELVRQDDRYGYIHDEVFREMGDALGTAFEQAVSKCLSEVGETAN